MKRIRWMIYGMLLTVGCAVASGMLFMYSGIYNVAAKSGHTRMVNWALEQGMRASVRRHSASVQAPAPIDDASLRKGALCFHTHCVQCHGGPGKSPADIGKGLQPIASSLVQTGRDWSLEEIYWVASNGIRMAGMPAWEFRLAEHELWAIAAFVQMELPRLGVEEYDQRIAAAATERCEPPSASAAPQAERGRLTIRQYGCHGCHIIPGITGPDIHVGPSLQQFATRPLIAGAFANNTENLVRWLKEPHTMRPRTLMPDLGVTEQHARDMQAYLATLD